jgi:hypothetical protein
VALAPSAAQLEATEPHDQLETAIMSKIIVTMWITLDSLVQV